MNSEHGGLESYFKWLVDKTKCSSPNNRYYQKLLIFLFFKPFRPIVERDTNRIADGITLRGEFEDISGILINNELECSVLEVLIALSIRCDQNIIGDPDVNKEYKLFWLMIHNLRLDHYEDPLFDENICNFIVDKWLSGDIKPNGEGGLFPLKYPARDQRNLEIWVQMQDYLAEKFEGEEEW